MNNYAKLVAPDGEIAGVLQLEAGTLNEVLIVEGALELGFKLEQCTEEEYNNFDGDEIKPDWME
jgi:hypothetical protein